MLNVLVAASMAATQAAQAGELPSSADISAQLAKLAPEGKGAGAVVGLIDSHGPRVVATPGMSGDTVFEIGSISKAFTGLLLAEMAERHEVALDEPLQKLLPASVHVPSRGRAITLLDLATYTSGLPRLPDNLDPKDGDQPYADYGADNLYAFLAGYQLPRDVGAGFEYSNLGFGLLGHALSLRAKTSYEAALRTRVLEPLGMKDTGIALSPAQEKRLAQPRGPGGPVPAWKFDALAGAGALRSTANDLLKLIAAGIAGQKAPLAAALAQSEKPRHAALPPVEAGLGFFVGKREGHLVVEKDGMTAGSSSYLAFDPERRVGVVVLTNQAHPVNALGLRILSGSFAAPDEVALAPGAQAQYVGAYQVAPKMVLSVLEKDGKLLTRMTGQPALALHASAPDQFFLSEVDAQLEFVRESGKIAAVVLHQNGYDTRAARISDRPEEQAAAPKEVAVDAAALDAYTGEYQLAPAFSIVVGHEGAQLFAQATKQPRFPLFASGPDKFFYKVVDAQVDFVRENGKVMRLVLHQGGRDLPGEKVK